LKESQQKNTSKIRLGPFHIIFFFIVLCIYIGATYLPMVNVIGYESSVLAGIILSVVGGLSTIKFLRSGERILSTGDLRKKTWPFFLTLVIITITVPLCSTLLSGNCPYWDGMWFYLVISLPSLLIGISLGALWFKLLNRFQYFFFLLSILIIMLLPLIELFLNPQIYFYNPIIGFFPGTIYDEDIKIDKLMILYRVANLIYFRMILFVAFMLPTSRVFLKYSSFAALLILPVIFSVIKPEYELATNINRLEKELEAKAVTDNFTIRYSKELTQGNINNLILHHEYYYDMLPRLAFVQIPDKIQSFIFNNREHKRKLFGAGRADVAKPWLYQLYTQADSYSGSLKHELAHVFSAEHGISFLKLADNFNPALIEGYAMVLENNYDDLDPHYLAKLAESSGYKTDIGSLFSGFNFFGNTSSISYIYSGSFLKYLAGKYGFIKLNKLYSDLDFEKQYGSNMDSLIEEYNSFLSKLKYSPNSAAADLYFGYKPIFEKICIRQRANDLNNAQELYSNRNFADAAAEFERIYNYSDAYPALLGYIQSLEKLEDTLEAQSYLITEIDSFKNTSYYFNLQMVLGDLYIKNKSFDDANSLFRDFTKNAPNNSYYTQALFRSYLIRRGNEFAYTYVTGELEEKYDMLLQINRGNLVYESIPSLITISKLLDKDPSEIEKLLETQFRVEGALSSYCAFYVSNYFVDTNNYKLARKFSALSVKYCPLQSVEVRKAQLDKIEWFIKFGDSVLENTEFTY